MTGKRLLPTQAATALRIRLFQPTQRPREQSGKLIETPWGECRVKGRLGQRHADVIESILFSAERKRTTEDGAVEVLIDPAKIRRMLSDRGHSGARLKAWIEELMGAVVEVKTDWIHVTGHLVDHVVHSQKTRSNPLNDKERHLWRVRLGLPLVTLIEKDRPMNHDPQPIARLEYGISQAVARHVLTHSTKSQPNGGWKMDTAIEAVSGKLTSGTMRNRRRELRRDAEGLRESGIEITDKGRIIKTK